jgi:hypothetical protein
MEITFEGRCLITLEHRESDNKSSLISTDFNLHVSKNLEESMYFDEELMPNGAGSKALTQCFIQGLVGNIHYSHEKGFRDSAEHLRYIISELERGFIQIADIKKSNFKE